MGHLVLGEIEMRQDEDYQMSGILQNWTIASKNRQYSSVQENTEPVMHDQPIIPRPRGQCCRLRCSGSAAVLYSRQGPLQRVKRTMLLPRRPERQSIQPNRLRAFWLVASFFKDAWDRTQGLTYRSKSSPIELHPSLDPET